MINQQRDNLYKKYNHKKNMFTKKEIILISFTIIIFAFLVNLSSSLIENWKVFLNSILIFGLLIFGNVLAKKITAFYLDTEIEMNLWEAGKFFSGNKKGKKPLPLGAILPVLTKIIFFPFTAFFWMASLIFDVRPRIYRGAKRHGLYTFSDISEYDIGLIAAVGVITNLIFASVGYLLGFSLFSQLNIYFAFFNIIPISELDGNKIFFGSKVLWSVLATIVTLGMLLTIFII